MRVLNMAPAYVLLAKRAERDPIRDEFSTLWTCVRLNEVPRLPLDWRHKGIYIDRSFLRHDLAGDGGNDMAAMEISRALSELVRHAVHEGCGVARDDEYLLMPELALRQAKAAMAKSVADKQRDLDKQAKWYARLKAVVQSRKDRPRLP